MDGGDVDLLLVVAGASIQAEISVNAETTLANARQIIEDEILPDHPELRGFSFLSSRGAKFTAAQEGTKLVVKHCVVSDESLGDIVRLERSSNAGQKSYPEDPDVFDDDGAGEEDPGLGYGGEVDQAEDKAAEALQHIQEMWDSLMSSIAPDKGNEM